MKCPKCGYLGFEPVERCRNCGYDFSLTSNPSPPLELPLKQDPGRAETEAPSGELPLFSKPLTVGGDDVPLITKASPPRAPLAVRRATPEVPRLRATTPTRVASLDLGFDSAAADSTPPAAPVATRESAVARSTHRIAEQDASLAARLAAAALDGLILAAVDVAVVYFTLQICGISLDELRVLPWVPLGAFLVLQNGGYLVAFTAGGQTLGKMAMGIKVIAADSPSSVDIGSAFVRELTWLALALPAGLGLLSAAFSRDHRGLHDRFAGTRVVRASL
jgi:uncharacterized RDD family membrane protein YckC